MSDEDKAALIAKAEVLGIDVDKRWGTARLSAEIADVEARLAALVVAGPADGAAPDPEPRPEPQPDAPVDADAGLPALLIPTEGAPDFNDPALDGRAIVEAALARQQAAG